MVLQMKHDVQKGIAVRAAAHNLAVAVQGSVNRLREMVDELGTKTADRITQSRVRKLEDSSKEFTKLATNPKDDIPSVLQEKVQIAFLDIVKLAAEQKIAIFKEKNNHPRGAEKYDDILVELQVLKDLSISEVVDVKFDKKSEAIANDLAAVTTINGFASITRIKEFENNALIAFGTPFVEHKAKEMIGNVKADELDYFKEKLCRGLLSDFFVENGNPLLDNTFEPSVELEHLKSVKVPELIVKFLQTRKYKEHFENVVDTVYEAYQQRG